MSASRVSARRWYVAGRVQGVGFRWFVQKHALEIGLKGWVRNEDDGRVQVYAIGTAAQLDRLAGLLYLGPRLSDVRGVEQREATVQQLNSFQSL
ncbi:MAG: acylphosphatase [Acidobacteriota bacterium]|nr:acylphosphatase [Acidobacteriota bacterium]